MKEKFLKRKWLRVLAAVCMSVMLLLSMVQGAFAAEDSGRTTGSLSLTLAVTEDGEQVPLTGGTGRTGEKISKPVIRRTETESGICQGSCSQSSGTASG